MKICYGQAKATENKPELWFLNPLIKLQAFNGVPALFAQIIK